MVRLFLLLCLFVAGARAEDDQTRGFVGLRGNDLHVEAPEGGRVFVGGVDVAWLEQELHALKEEHKADVEMLQRVLCGAGLVNFVTVAQTIDTNGANDWEHFVMEGAHFLAVASYRNGNMYSIPSVIYRWNDSTKQFEEAQSINTVGAYDWEHFVIDGVHFLAVASYRNGNMYSIPSVIYQWNTTVKQFEEAQLISTHGAVDWEHFEIDGAHFLAVANAYNDNTYYNVPSIIYQWNNNTNQFEEVQSINTNAALHWEHFEINGVDFLAVANYQNGNTHNLKSTIFQWNTTAKLFEEAQSIDTHGAIDWEYFEIDGAQFLAVTNGYNDNDNTYNIPSVIYRWNDTAKWFEEAQSIRTKGARDWEHFVMNGNHFLAVANRDNTPSVIYRWNITVKQFEEAQSVNTNVARDWEHFVMNGNHFLAVANFNISSVIYQLNPLCV